MKYLSYTIAQNYYIPHNACTICSIEIIISKHKGVYWLRKLFILQNIGKIWIFYHIQEIILLKKWKLWLIIIQYLKMLIIYFNPIGICPHLKINFLHKLRCGRCRTRMELKCAYFDFIAYYLCKFEFYIWWDGVTLGIGYSVYYYLIYSWLHILL